MEIVCRSESHACDTKLVVEEIQRYRPLDGVSQLVSIFVSIGLKNKC